MYLVNCVVRSYSVLGLLCMSFLFSHMFITVLQDVKVGNIYYTVDSALLMVKVFMLIVIERI